MTDLPDPLVPVDVDLRDFSYMPLEIGRLFGSEFHALASDAEWRAGLTLWGKSYHQVPASSIPDDDVALARLAEFGRDIRGWKKVRARALHGWVKCSDGLLYHPVVAEKALEAWVGKLHQRKLGAAGNAKRHGNVFNPAPFDIAIADTLGRLAKLNPGSRSLTKRGGIPAGDVRESHQPPGGIPAGSQERERGKEKEDLCPIRPRPVRAKPTYPADFEAWWRGYPTSPNMPKPKAAEAWAKLDDEDRAAAAAALPGFLAHCRKNPTYSPCYAQKWLNERRFDGFAPKSTTHAGGEATINFGGGYSAPESVVVSTIRRGHWVPHWGPKVGEPGCLVPQHVIEAAGH